MQSDLKPPPQLLKWIGNKQRFAPQIIASFPAKVNSYFEPFLGSGAVLGGYAPNSGYASDVLEPLIEIWQLVKDDPVAIVESYDHYRSRIDNGETKQDVYRSALDRFNSDRRAREFVFLSRACYGGVIRFRSKDGHMSTPVGAHTPISTETFASRVEKWNQRIQNTEFAVADYSAAFERAQEGDLIYCDPPYVDSQKILYGAQRFIFSELIELISFAKSRGVNVALSIDGTKKNGTHEILLGLPEGLFETEVSVSVGKSMLKRFQAGGANVQNEGVSDRLLLTYAPETIDNYLL